MKEVNGENLKLKQLLKKLQEKLILERKKNKRLLLNNLISERRQIKALQEAMCQKDVPNKILNINANYLTSENSCIDIPQTNALKNNKNLYEKLSNSSEDNSVMYLRPYGSKFRGKLYMYLPQKNTDQLSSWNLSRKADILWNCLNILSNKEEKDITRIVAKVLNQHNNIAEKLAASKNVTKISGKLNDSDTVDIMKRLKLSWSQLVLMKRFLKLRGFNIFSSTPAVHREIGARTAKATCTFHSFQRMDKNNEQQIIPAVLIDDLVAYVQECWENILSRNEYIEKPEFKNYVYIGNLFVTKKRLNNKIIHL